MVATGPATVGLAVALVLGVVYGFALVHLATDAVTRRDLKVGAKVFWLFIMVSCLFAGLVAYYLIVYRRRR